MSQHPAVKVIYKTGILGGMFDPVHSGHIRAAQTALETLGLDEVRMMPCSRPVHRRGATASNTHRLAMLRLATEDREGLVVDDRECVRDGPSWTVVSLETLHAERPRASLYLLMGTDTFATLETWHRWQDLFELCHLVIISRPGVNPDYSPVLAAELKKREAKTVEQLHQQVSGLIFTGLGSETELSSTHVRECLRTGKSVHTLLPAAVLEYISQHQLYARQPETGEHLKPQETRDLAVSTIEDMKGQQLTCLQIGDMSSFADYMLVVTGTSSRHVKSIADELLKKAKAAGLAAPGIEGEEQGEWVLVDLGDVIVHVMQADIRSLYDLESLWAVGNTRAGNED